MTTLADHAERERFVTVHGKNISVIAPAGVGKTHAIVQRIVALASQPEAIAIDRLGRLIVVTYSVRAAQQMQQRAREAIRDAAVSPAVQRAFQQVFFGTIHSYCVQLLDRFGHYLGLPSPVALLQNHDEWWNRFLVRGLSRVGSDEGVLAELFHFYSPEKLYALGKEVSPGEVSPVPQCPALDLRALLVFPLDGLHHSTKRSLAAAQAAASRWNEAWSHGDRFYPLPSCPATLKAPDFISLWERTFAPLQEWLRHAALAFGREVANAYEAFRLSEAMMTYDDQVHIALRLLDLPPVQRELADDRLSVLLDEAQDTDPRQFELLRRVAGLQPGAVQAEDQSFCIVGDFQQASYTPRSDLSFYRTLHDELILEPRGASSQLRVTFRCDEAIIRFVNKIFPSILHGAQGQSEFFDLMPRDEAGPGQVARWSCPDEPAHAAGSKVKADVRAAHEARFLAEQLAQRSPADLGATSWTQVAILCPRKNWLLQIARELSAAGLPVQLHSSDETANDSTPGSWLTALIWVVAHPEDSFEIAGVLREVFGVSDHDIAVFTRGEGDRLRLDRPISATRGPVQTALRILAEAAAFAHRLPLHQLVRQMVEKTRLRERLRTLREFELENADQEIDDFLAMVFHRSAEGGTLPELAQELRLGLAQSTPAEEEIRDAIQLMTSHKAKGLEWQTVILPYVFRAIESKTLAYPRLVYGEGSREMIFRDKTDYTAQAKAFVLERDRQQLQRLLYVMCTRAKQTLLLLDDETLFEGQRSRGGWSSGELLGFLGGLNRVTWQALPEALELAGTPAVPMPAPAKAAAELLPAFSAKDFARAQAQARAIPQRITPHALAIHSSQESEPEKLAEREEDPAVGASSNPGILYGTWWHELVQAIPWNQPREAWQRRFAAALPHAPQAERAQREWDLLCRSQLAQWLAGPGRLVQRELPFLAREENESWLEGVIDLAVFDSTESVWQVIDWKTNRPGPGGGEAVVQIYREQILAYVRALKKMLSAEVRGSLYLTPSGEWIPVD
jgi:ATP-dependent exoDNAse (exonuclease V) beta subunit